MPTYIVRRAAAMLTGVALIAAETTLAISYIRTPGAGLADLIEQPLVIAVAIAGLAQAIAVAVLSGAMAERRWGLALVTLAGLASAVAFTFSTTYERTAGARETRRIAIETANSGMRSASSRVASLQERRAAECATRGGECRKLERELTEARATLSSMPSERETRLLGRLDIVPELALPLMLMLLGFAFIHFATEAGTSRSAQRMASAQTSFPTDVEPPPANLFKPDVDADTDERAAAVSSFVTAHIRKHGRAPRHRDVMAATGLPKATTTRYMRRVRVAG